MRQYCLQIDNWLVALIRTGRVLPIPSILTVLLATVQPLSHLYSLYYPYVLLPPTVLPTYYSIIVLLVLKKNTPYSATTYSTPNLM